MRTMTHASSFLGGWRFSFKGRVLQNKRSSCRGRKSRRLSLPYTWLPIAMQKFTDIINTRKLGSLLAISTMGGSREVWNATNENMYITNTLSIDRRLVCGNFQEKELHLSCMLYKLLKYCKMLLWSCKLLKLLLSLVSCKSLKFMNSQKEIIPHSQNAWAPINPHSTIFSPGEREKKKCIYIYIHFQGFFTSVTSDHARFSQNNKLQFSSQSISLGLHHFKTPTWLQFHEIKIKNAKKFQMPPVCGKLASLLALILSVWQVPASLPSHVGANG